MGFKSYEKVISELDKIQGERDGLRKWYVERAMNRIEKLKGQQKLVKA
jgi:hypothetical protein